MEQKLHVIDCCQQAGKAIKNNFVATMIYPMVSWLIVTIVGYIPIIGILIFPIITGPLFAGIFMVMSRAIKGEAVPFDTLFRGFDNFLANFLGYIVPTLFTMLAMIPLFVVGFASFWPLITQMGETGEAAHMTEFPLILLSVGIVTAIVVAIIYMACIFVFLEIYEKRVSVWPAIKGSCSKFAKAPLRLCLIFLIVYLIAVPLIFLVVPILFANQFIMLLMTAAYYQLSPELGQAPELVNPTDRNRLSNQSVIPPFPDELPSSVAEQSIPDLPSKASGRYVRAYVFIEAVNLSLDLLKKTVGSYNQEALDSLPENELISMRVDLWPKSKEQLQDLLQRGIKQFQSAKGESGAHTDPKRYSVKVFSGKDRGSGKNFAIAIVTQK
ncbi:MAG: hypothetical protein ACN4E2_03535 [Nitrospinota bacterium]